MTEAPRPRPSKKSEMLEVRLDYETKQEFLAACRDAGRTASDVVREQIAIFLAESRQAQALETAPAAARVIDFVPAPLRKTRWAAAGAAAVGLAMAAALPSAATTGPKAPFDTLDANRDGVLSPEEYVGKPETGECSARLDQAKRSD